MLKKAFDALTVGDRVAVTGTQDGQKFEFEVGTVIANPHGPEHERLIRFDTWSDGHGVGNHEWGFYDYDRKKFAITVVTPAAKIEPAKPEPVKPKKRPHGAQEYKGNGKHKWETVTDTTVRLRVPGGWLYGKQMYSGTVMAQTTFVPVPQAVGYAV